MLVPSLRNFVVNDVIGENARVPAVLGRDAKEIVTHDRTLRDAALAVLALGGAADIQLTRRLLESLEEFEDADHVGFHELLDFHGARDLLGYVRTPAWQALAAWAYYQGGNVLGLDRFIQSGQRYLLSWADSAMNHGWPISMDRTGTMVLDSGSALSDIAILVIAANAVCDKSAFWATFFNKATLYLEKFVSNEGVWATIFSSGAPDLSYGYRLRASALGAMAWCILYERGYCNGLVYATKALIHVKSALSDPRTGGLWDRADYDSRVRVNPVASFYGRRSATFPAKLMADHALLALSADMVASVTKDVQFEEVAAKARIEIGRHMDPSVGGVFEGQSSWFSTPTDPTVPLARQVMVPPRTAGAFAVGNTSYVPLHEKHAGTQLLALMAMGDREVSFDETPHLPRQLEPWPLKKDLSYIASGRISEGVINVPAYIGWLRSTTSGVSHGLTPYRAPLGVRSDRAPQTFSVLHVVADLLLLNEPIYDATGLLNSIFASQNPDGGFGEQAGMLSEAFTTYCAVLTFTILGGTGFNKDRCIEYLDSCQHPSGGFGNAPGYPCDIWHSNLSVLALHAMGRRPPREADLIAFIISCRNGDGGYGNRPGEISDVFATFRALDTLVALSLSPPNVGQTVAYLRGLQRESGGFLYRSNGVVSFVGTYHAVAALYVLGARPDDVPACIRYIAERQCQDGGFSRVPNAPSETTDEGFIAVHAIHMLENTLNPYWAVIIT